METKLSRPKQSKQTKKTKKKKPFIIESESPPIKPPSLPINNHPCDEEVVLKNNRDVLKENIKQKHNECEASKYNIIYKYFYGERKSTFKGLLNALMHYYKDKKRDYPEFTLYFQEFIDMFELDTNSQTNFKRQHVFEALCKILLMYDYDRGELGVDKQFYNSLEEFIKNPNNPNNIKDRDEIIKEDINVSSEGGVVDIFFKTKTKQSDTFTCEWSCDCAFEESQTVSEERQEYILIQNKYYSKEKSDIKNYDVTKIYAKARSLYDSSANIVPKIILMVNNKQSLDEKLRRSRDASKGLISDIYGVYEINNWFRELLYDLYNSTDINTFLREKGHKDKQKYELGPRFHQMYFTESTTSYYNEGYKKFIWGAVPRSGKSFMIGDLISKRQKTHNNDIIMILGAKTETESQFVKMFCEYADFSSYGIIKVSSSKMKTIKECPNLNTFKEKNIFIFSQEWFKDKIIIENFTPVFNFGKKKSIFDRLFFERNNVDIYFDEIHKGGSTDKSENILNAIHSCGVRIDIFIMVTATFAKPNIKYKTNFIDTKEPKILEWSYEDQQIMKNITNETKMDMMINSRIGTDTERKIIIKIFEKYKFIYGAEYLDIISKQYERHPELVLVQPFDKIKLISDTYSEFQIDKVFKSNLQCDACFEEQSLSELRDPHRIFFDYGRVQKLLQLIAGNLNPSTSVYGYLKAIGAPDYSQTHSELWFLPDDDLYVNPDECRGKDNIKGKCSLVTNPDNHNEDSKLKRSLPNIEPLTRGLAFALMEHPFFKEYYNVLIVHNTSQKFKDKETKGKLTHSEIFANTGIFTTIDSDNLSETIKDCEMKSKKHNKNLIILTGAKLRLGISLPCADIGFNFDNIKSIDLNYQTMFRVLTERYNKPKKYGYYVDFNKERFIQFLYEYSNTYSSAKNISNIKENLSQLQGLLILFNINGLGLEKLNEKQELTIYDSLIEELKLDENGYAKFYSKFDNITNLFKKSLITVDMNDLKQISKLFDSTNPSKTKPKKTKVVVKEGKNVSPAVTNPNENNEDDDEEKNDEEKNDDDIEDDSDPNSQIIDIISDILPRIIALLSLFSHQYGFNCDNLVECLEKSMSKIHEFGSLCDCNNNVDTSDILSCYLNSPFYHDKLFLLLEKIKELLENPDNSQLFNTANFIFNNIKGMSRINNPLIYSMDPKDIQEKIEKYLPVREEKKNKNGEVFTPISLIEELLDKLPNSVWSNPELKWLDPANGIGNFPMVVYQKLLKELPDRYDGENGKYSDEKGKKKHIIENMLYMVELDPANVKISRRIFGKNANISCSSFLEDKWIRDFKGVNQFNIIIGNPPFQKEQEGKREGGYGGRTLWDKFIVKSFELLKLNGYLCFITPPSWRKPEHELYNLMTKDNQLLYLHIYGEKQGQQLFDVSQRIDLYVIQKHIPTKNTEIIDEVNNKIDLDVSNWKFIPNYEFDNIKKIMTTEENGIKVIYDRTIYGTDKVNMSNKQTEKYKYPIVHSINQEGLVFWYTDDKTKGHFGVPKVLLNFNRHQYPVNDYEGKYGMSQITFGIPITSKKQGDGIVKAINSDAFKEIIKATKWGAFQTDWRMFKYFKPDFYKHFLDKSEAVNKITTFDTKKHREKQAKKTHKVSKGGSHTKKHNRKNNRTRKFFFF